MTSRSIHFFAAEANVIDAIGMYQCPECWEELLHSVHQLRGNDYKVARERKNEYNHSHV